MLPAGYVNGMCLLSDLFSCRVNMENLIGASKSLWGMYLSSILKLGSLWSPGLFLFDNLQWGSVSGSLKHSFLGLMSMSYLTDACSP